LAQAILAQGSSRKPCLLRPAARPSPRPCLLAMACYDSYGILFKLHHRLLHKLSAEVGLPCQGVSQAARILRKNGKLSSNMTKRIVGLDTAFHIIRHLTQEKAVDFFIKVEKDVCFTSGGDSCHGNPDGGCARGGTVDSRPVQQRRMKKDEEELVASPTSACPTEEALTDNEQEEGSTSPPTAAAMTPATAASSLAAATSPAVAIPASVGDPIAAGPAHSAALCPGALRDRAKNELDQVIDPYLHKVACMRSLMERLPRDARLEKEDEVNELEALIRTMAKRAFGDITQSLGLCSHASDHLHQHISIKLAGINKRGMPVQHSKSKYRKKKGL